MVAVIGAVVVIGLIIFNICLLGSYRYDLRRLNVRVEEAEAQVQNLRGDMTNFSRRQLDALWMRAQQEVDREIVRARERYHA
ncbi:hypothetical protein [Amycolatopsis sp. NPDC051102]|uniref:hypothetical protein n=1 Tax=Amycolatopsis sp. NPDC051102 TaxID=3155163 RepID=UPI0034365644